VVGGVWVFCRGLYLLSLMLIIVLCIYHDYYSCEKCTKSFWSGIILKKMMPIRIRIRLAIFFFLQIFSIWVSKNAEFDADFESIEKVFSVFTMKVRGLRTFVHSTKRWKSTQFLHFYANSFFMNFLCFFHQIWN
jgi:hypothetical protein